MAHKGSAITVRDMVTDTVCDSLSSTFQRKIPCAVVLLLQYCSVILGAALHRISTDTSVLSRSEKGVITQLTEYLTEEDEKMSEMTWLKRRHAFSKSDDHVMNTTATQTDFPDCKQDFLEKHALLVKLFSQTQVNQDAKLNQSSFMSHSRTSEAKLCDAVLGEPQDMPKALKSLPSEYLQQEHREALRFENEAMADRQRLKQEIESQENQMLKELEELQDSEMCNVCATRQINTLLLPCAHFAICQCCAQNLRSCPLCREPIQATVRALRA